MSEETFKSTQETLFRIEDAKPEDAEAMRAIVRTRWLEIYPNEEHGITEEDIMGIDWQNKEYFEKRRKEILENQNTTRTWVIKNNKDEIVGFCKVSRRGEALGEIDAIYTLPGCEGRGLGNQLIQKAFEWLGPDMDVRLKVVKYNHHAIEFYKKFGFKETGKVVSYEGTQLKSGKIVPRIEMLRLKNPQ